MDNNINNQNVTVQICKRVENDGETPKLIIVHESSKEILDKPVLLCLGGNKTEDAKRASGVAKIVNGFVGKFNEPYDIYSISYGEDYMMNRDANAKFLCDKLFLPLVMDSNGKRLPFELAMKKMRRVNVFTHCMGNFRLDAVLRELKIAMEKLGYTKQEKEAILGQIFVVGYAPWSLIKDKDVKKLYLQSIEDNVSPKLTEHLFNLQTKSDNKELDIEVSDPGMVAKSREIYKIGYIFRIYRLLNYNKILSFVHKNDNMLCYISKCQSVDCENYDHELRYVARDSKFGLSENSSVVADAISLCISETLLANLANSISNEYKIGYEQANSIEMIKDICDSVISRRLSEKEYIR